MKYQITYMSPHNTLDSLIAALRENLPADTAIQTLTMQSRAEGQVQIVGLELGFRNMEKLPEEAQNYLRTLDGKQLILFATLPFYIDESQKSQIHKAVSKLIPQECVYLGLFLCTAQPDPAILEGFRHAMEQKPESTRIRYWLKRCEYAVGHPDERDRTMLCNFAKQLLLPEK